MAAKIEAKQSFSSLVSIDPYKNNYFSDINSFLRENPSAHYEKTQYVISFINTKSFITSQLDINKNIPDEDIADVIESKVYEELALDVSIEYIIKYIEFSNNSDEDSRSFHVFVVESNKLEEQFSKVVEQIKYIDQIIPLPLLIQGLYTNKIIDESGIHAFLYLQENDAFLLYIMKQSMFTQNL
jgi:hypothetical protein